MAQDGGCSDLLKDVERRMKVQQGEQSACLPPTTPDSCLYTLAITLGILSRSLI
jgi:hypothetical protein